MTRGDQRNRNRDKATKKRAEKNIQANNKVGKPKKADTQLQKMKYYLFVDCYVKTIEMRKL